MGTRPLRLLNSSSAFPAYLEALAHTLALPSAESFPQDLLLEEGGSCSHTQTRAWFSGASSTDLLGCIPQDYRTGTLSEQGLANGSSLALVRLAEMALGWLASS